MLMIQLRLVVDNVRCRASEKVNCGKDANCWRALAAPLPARKQSVARTIRERRLVRDRASLERELCGYLNACGKSD